MADVVRGSCLCGAVRYEVSGPISQVGHCHCVDCRKAQGAPFATNGTVAEDCFLLVSGAEDLPSYESAPGKHRQFCRHCGSSIAARFDGLPVVRIRLGTLDDDPGARPAGHFWTSDRAPWEEIVDSLPQVAGET